MNFVIKIKLTHEITDEEWVIWVNEFNKIFHTDYNLNDFLNKYIKNPNGFSFHSMLYEDGVFAGAQSYIIEDLYYKNELIKIACSCDTFIKKEHRKEFNSLFAMDKEIEVTLKLYGIEAVIGSPSLKLFQYYNEVESGYKLIGNFCTYVLPLSFKIINKNLSFLDVIYTPIIQLILKTFGKSNDPLYRGLEKFKMSNYFSPYDYATFQEQIGVIKFSWLWDKATHIRIINDNFNCKGDLFMASMLLLKKYKGRIEAVIYSASQKKLILPFVFFHNREIFMGKLLSSRITENDFYNIENWEFKRGFFD